MPKIATHAIAAEQSAESIKRLAILKSYYQLAKPGITWMVVFTTIAGYLLGISNAFEYFGDISNVVRFFLTVIGTALTCASSCAFNNVIERSYDKLMKRTFKRALPSGEISPRAGVVFASSLAVAGIILLSFVDFTVVLLSAMAIISYVLVYTPLKRKSETSLLVGAIPGALPPLGGWVAATSNIGIEGMLLFAILFFWQLPHFLSLSWMYKTDYTRGGYRMLAVRDEDGKKVAWQSLIYTILLILSAAGLFVAGSVGLLYAAGSMILGGILAITCRKFLINASHTTARQVLLMSYVYLMGIVILMLVDKT